MMGDPLEAVALFWGGRWTLSAFGTYRNNARGLACFDIERSLHSRVLRKST